MVVEQTSIVEEQGGKVVEVPQVEYHDKAVEVVRKVRVRHQVMQKPGTLPAGESSDARIMAHEPHGPTICGFTLG